MISVITDERCTGYSSFGHPERPQRISNTLEKLRSQTDLEIDWQSPLPVADEIILRAHSHEHLHTLRNPVGDFDADTPAYPDIEAYALRSVGSALRALTLAQEGKTAFSLMRPPGHHAERNRIMGFCFLNSVAIAALEAQQRGYERVAVFDFDVHHGNGTEDILRDREGMAFFSIHQHPCYPGTGATDVGSNCFNFPVAPGTPREQYRETISRALEKLKNFNPDLIAVSAGFDAYARDPLAQGTLEAGDFQWIGEQLRGLGTPFFGVLEGGYSRDLPDLIFAYLKGIDKTLL